MRRKVLWLTFWVTMVFWFGQGCGPAQLNESNRLYGTRPIPGVARVVPVEFTGERSVHGVDRSDWPKTEILLARQSTQTRPVYWQSRLRVDTSRRRVNGAYPTLESALELGQSDEDVDGQIVEAVWDPFAQLLNLALVPVQLLTTNPIWHVEHSPRRPYALLPERDTVVLYPEEEKEPARRPRRLRRPIR